MNPQLTTAGKAIGLIAAAFLVIGSCMTVILVISLILSFGSLLFVIGMTIHSNPISGMLLFFSWPVFILIGVFLRDFALSARFSRMRELSSYEGESREPVNVGDS